MLITLEMPESQDYRVFDFADNMLGFITSFDTDTCEIEMAVHVREGKLLTQKAADGKPAHMFLKFTLPGAYAAFKGERIA